MAPSAESAALARSSRARRRRRARAAAPCEHRAFARLAARRRSRPPMPSTSALTIVRPMPVPSMPSFSAPKRLNGSNRLAICSASGRGRCRAPRSVALSPSPARHSTTTRPPRRLYLIAFDSRLISTWRSRVGSARGDAARRSPISSDDAVLRRQRLRPAAATGGPAAPRSTGSSDSWSSPASRPERSSTSLISESRWSPAARMCSSLASWRACRPSGAPRSAAAG